MPNVGETESIRLHKRYTQADHAQKSEDKLLDNSTNITVIIE